MHLLALPLVNAPEQISLNARKVSVLPTDVSIVMIWCHWAKLLYIFGLSLSFEAQLNASGSFPLTLSYNARFLWHACQKPASLFVQSALQSTSFVHASCHHTGCWLLFAADKCSARPKTMVQLHTRDAPPRDNLFETCTMSNVISVNGKTHLQCICKFCSGHCNTPHGIQNNLAKFPTPQISSSQWQRQEMSPPSSRQSFGSFEIRMLRILHNSPYNVKLQPR